MVENRREENQAGSTTRADGREGERRDGDVSRMIIGMHVPVATMRQKMEHDALQAHLIDHLCGAGPGGTSQIAKKEKASAPGEKAAPTPIVLDFFDPKKRLDFLDFLDFLSTGSGS